MTGMQAYFLLGIELGFSLGVIILFIILIELGRLK